MENIHYYNINVTWNEGRIGTLTAESLPDIKVATPPEFPKGVPGIWSPEHLFVSSVAICLMTTFVAIAENSSLAFNSFKCGATGKLEKVDGNIMISEIELKPEIIIPEEKYIEKAGRIIEKSEKMCLISNSVKTKIFLSPDIKTSDQI
jgi:organic hydroperoxide reductase OsmC/OhrA